MVQMALVKNRRNRSKDAKRRNRFGEGDVQNFRQYVINLLPGKSNNKRWEFISKCITDRKQFDKLDYAAGLPDNDTEVLRYLDFVSRRKGAKKRRSRRAA
jgi:hypothetical protein